MFRLNTKGQLTSGEWCTTADGGSSGLLVSWCTPGTVDGPWEFSPRSDNGPADQGHLIHTKLGTCMSMDIQSKQPILSKCDPNNAYHIWQFKVIEPYWAS